MLCEPVDTGCESNVIVINYITLNVIQSMIIIMHGCNKNFAEPLPTFLHVLLIGFLTDNIFVLK